MATMKRQSSRRDFVRTSLLASSALPLALAAQLDATAATTEASPAQAKQAMPMGRLGNREFSRLFLGGNLFGGWSHSRELTYVSTLAKRYNTPAKIRETFELAEGNGITAFNSWVMQDNQALFDHWKNGGKIMWFSQVRLDNDGGYSQIHRAIDEGATGVHITGDTAEKLLAERKFDKVGETIELIQSKKRIAGVCAHDLRVIVECEKRGLTPDFYQKTFHSLDYYTAPRPDEKEAMGAHDNSWCNDPQAVAEVMARTKKPWIAFKILAAGAIPPKAAFPYAFESGADFILVGMFDWQVAENASLACRVIDAARGAGSRRARSWFS
jgi:hypothetical protein